LNWSHPRNPQ